MAKTRRKIKRRKSRRNKRRGGATTIVQQIMNNASSNINNASIQKNTKILVQQIEQEPTKYTEKFKDKVKFLMFQLKEADLVDNVRKTIDELKQIPIYNEATLNNTSAF